ncbi:MAG: hypothetical protein GWO24_02735, partial [Akkermansiaceae bacterium]|nr:hypothetical protein [Akkermansiaceae bacterium]
MRYPWNHLAVLLLAALPAAAGPGEQASLPYALVYRLAMQAAADNGSNEVATIRFTSALPGVTPDAVELRIDSSAGPIPLQLGGDGTCRVPLSDALLRENPPIRSNQPKGSMRVTAAIKRDIPLAPDGSVGYRELMNPLTLSRRMKEKMQDTADLIWAKHLESLVVHI